jgi:lycopene beta-cyclase
MPQYDYIIAGTGAAGLSLVTRMITRPWFRDKKILLVDREEKNKNDRTWCFWEKEEGFFQSIVFREWEQLWFHGEGYDALNHIRPYKYKLIRGIDFYEYCFTLIRQAPNVTIRYGSIDHIISSDAGTWIEIDNEQISSEYIFSSIVPDKPHGKGNELLLLQHFKGWFIETPMPAFDPAAATLMDFRVQQTKGTTFVYVMPFSPTSALVEYTLFSEALIDANDYDQALRSYITHTLKIASYSVQEEEFGVIPMTNRVFPSRLNNIIYLGTAGGQTKPSSGYTFQFIQRHSNRIVDALEKTGKPMPGAGLAKKRFRMYDSTLLNILANKKMEGSAIFTDLFSNNKMTEVLQFLDNETSLSQELRLVSVLPTRLFLRAAIQQLR